MKWLFIFGIPLVALGVSGWAAWQVQQPVPGQSGAIVMMLPGEMPRLNPFLPATEAERQILDLLHEPLIRLDGQGRLSAGLAESWAWHQRVTCWFPTEESLQEAQRRLAEVPPATRQSWELEEVTAQGLSLVLRFSRPGGAGVEEALQSLASDALLPLTFLRLGTAPAARAALEEYARAPENAASLMRLWFDEDGTCELVTTRPWLQVRESLSSWLVQKGQPVPSITPLAEVAGLLEPVLEFELNASRHAWPDGSPVTVADVRATVEHLRRWGYPVPGREGFRHIQDISAQGSTKVSVTYRRRYGAALAGWVGLPILQAAWLEANPEGLEELPPGCGSWQAMREGSGLILRPQGEKEAAPVQSLRVITASSALQARVALATGRLDVIWPGNDPALSQEASLDYHPVPARNRLMILWNLRSSCLSELPVREALAVGLDREALLAVGDEVQARLARPLFSPDVWYAPKAPEPLDDLEAARQKLEAAGWLRDVAGVVKKGGQALEFELLVTTGNRQREHLARLVAAQWAALGARVNITLVAPENLVGDHLVPGRFDAVLLGLDYDLSWDHQALWHSSQIPSGMNYARLADAQMDRLLEALVAEYDVSQLPLRARAVQDRFTVLQPALPLIGDLQQVGVRRARFPDLGAPDLQRPVTLRMLLHSSSPQSLLMRPPNE